LDVLLGAIPGLPKVHLHNPVLAYECGDDFMKYFYMAEERNLEPFVLVMEGSIPNEKIKKEGYRAALGTNPNTGQQAAKSVGAGARVLQLDDTNQGSIAAAAERIPERTRPSRRAREQRGVLHGEKPGSSLEEVVKSSRLSGVSRRGARGKPVHRPCVLELKDTDPPARG
jgi:hypothetical protein